MLLVRSLLGAFFCAMESNDLLRISCTVNVCTLLFFTSKRLADRLLVMWRETLDDRSVWRSIVEIGEDEPWRLPRFCLDVLQSAVLTSVGFAILCSGDVITYPFTGTFSNLTGTGFAVAIGCYIYRICQDTLLHSHLKNYRIDLVHHLVAVAVYCVFLSYRQNALFGAIGLICTGSVPGVEFSRLLKMLGETSGKPTALMVVYRRNLVAGAVITVVVRLVIPIMFGSLALATSTPLVMAVPVVAFFFASLMFFGSINVWLFFSSLLAIYRLRNKCIKDVPVGTPDAEDGRTFTTKSSHHATILAKQNIVSGLRPCANINVAPPRSSNWPKIANNAVLNNYAKMSVNEALVHPLNQTLQAGPSRQEVEHNQSPGPEELRMFHVGDEGENARPRSVRFLVPVTRSVRDQVRTSTSSSPSSSGSTSVAFVTPVQNPTTSTRENSASEPEQQRSTTLPRSAMASCSSLSAKGATSLLPGCSQRHLDASQNASPVTVSGKRHPTPHIDTLTNEDNMATSQENEVPATSTRPAVPVTRRAEALLSKRPFNMSLTNLATSSYANTPANTSFDSLRRDSPRRPPKAARTRSLSYLDEIKQTPKTGTGSFMDNKSL
ncbi:uncharacterized protein [Diadema antillarum]|uniref:uncharacterized protein n=1 Tax=Diadema antillarum TaxID=105358 RepID=UPI003A8A177B